MDVYGELRQALKDALARNHGDVDLIAEGVGVAPLTIRNWLRGRHLPYPCMTPPVISALGKI
jgi:hypothetical protein